MRAYHRAAEIYINIVCCLLEFKTETFPFRLMGVEIIFWPGCVYFKAMGQKNGMKSIRYMNLTERTALRNKRIMNRPFVKRECAYTKV